MRSTRKEVRWGGVARGGGGLEICHVVGALIVFKQKKISFVHFC